MTGATHWGGSHKTAPIRSPASLLAGSATIRSKNITWAVTSARWIIRAPRRRPWMCSVKTQINLRIRSAIAKPVRTLRARLDHEIQQHQPADDWNERDQDPPTAAVGIMQPSYANAQTWEEGHEIKQSGEYSARTALRSQNDRAQNLQDYR